MPYSMSNKPRWASKKSDSVAKTAIEVFNEEFKRSGSEQKARRASLAAMKLAEQANEKYSPVVKALNEEKRLATFLVLEPQDEDMTTSDLHGDWYDAQTVEDSCYNFNRNCMKANLFHMASTDAYEFVESFIQKTDCVLGNREIKKGSWLATIFVKETPLGDEIWKSIKNGSINGLSIQCTAISEDI